MQIVVDGAVGAAPVKDAMQRPQTALAEDKTFGPTPGRDGHGRRPHARQRPGRRSLHATSPSTQVRDLRADLIPPAFAGSGASVYVTGDTAGNVDYIDIVDCTSRS